jgi:hypothetical protein
MADQMSPPASRIWRIEARPFSVSRDQRLKS